MSAILRHLTLGALHGALQGAVNYTFGGPAAFIGFGQGAGIMPWGFGAFKPFNIWDNRCCCNSYPMYSVPNYSFGVFQAYNQQTPMPQPQFQFQSTNINIFTAQQAAVNTPILDTFTSTFTPTINNTVTPKYNFDNFNFGFYQNAISNFYSNIQSSTVKPAQDLETNDREKAKPSNNKSLKGKHWSEMSDAELKQVYGGYTRDITKKSNLAKDKQIEALNNYLKGKGVLEGKGEAFYNAQEKYGISASVLIGICMNESGQGTSKLANDKNNVGGVRKPGSTEFATYNKVEDCIEHIAKFLKNGYVNNSTRPLTKLYQVNAKYCPASDPTDTSGTNSLWAKNVELYASKVDEKLSSIS